MRILISAGGTGGGIYPALAVVQAVRRSSPTAELMWVGGQGGMEEELVSRAGIPLSLIPAAGLHGVGWRRWPGNARRLAAGARQAAGIVRAFQPDAVMVTGGYVAVPVALVARRRRVPVLMFVPDIEPALALRLVGRMATRIALSTEDSRQHYPRRRAVVVTGYPLRDEILHADRAGARQSLGFGREDFVLLVVGGSRGARSINQAVLAALPDLLRDLRVVHITGRLDWEAVERRAAQLPPALRGHYRPYAYLHEGMGQALAAADLVVSRAGASILGEYPFLGLPAILVPYPHAWRYQRTNADFLVRHGAALEVSDAALGRELVPAVRRLREDPARRSVMSAECRALAREDAADRIAAELISLARGEAKGQ